VDSSSTEPTCSMIRVSLLSFNRQNLNRCLKIFYQRISCSRLILSFFLILWLKYEVKPFRLRHNFYPSRIHRFTVLRSPHVHKTSRDQLEMKTHKLNLFLRVNNHSTTLYTPFLYYFARASALRIADVITKTFFTSVYHVAF
jgi:hypothetical protein